MTVQDKLTREAVIGIYTSTLNNCATAREWGTHERTVRRIKRKEAWKDITDGHDAARAGRDQDGAGDVEGEALPADAAGGHTDPARGILDGSERLPNGSEVVAETLADVGPGEAAGTGTERDATAAGENGSGDPGDDEGPSPATTSTEPAKDRDGQEGHSVETGAFVADGEPRYSLRIPTVTSQPTPYSGTEETQATVLQGINAAFLAEDPVLSDVPRVTVPDPDNAVFVRMGDFQAFTAQDGRRDFWSETLPPKKVKKRRVREEGEPSPPVCPPGLEARFVKVLLAAKQYGTACVSGGYGKRQSKSVDGTRPDPEVAESFIGKRSLARQMRLGLVMPGEHANTFVLTEAGKVRVDEYEAYLDAHNAYLNAMGEWRRNKHRKPSQE